MDKNDDDDDDLSIDDDWDVEIKKDDDEKNNNVENRNENVEETEDIENTEEIEPDIPTFSDSPEIINNILDETGLVNNELSLIPLDNPNKLNDIVDQMKKNPTIKINKLYTGITDPTKYKILKDMYDVEIYITPPDKVKTSNILLMPEKTNIIGSRAYHIDIGAEPYVDIINEKTSIEIAEKELKEKKNPFILLRKLNNYTYEAWDPNEMIINWKD